MLLWCFRLINIQHVKCSFPMSCYIAYRKPVSILMTTHKDTTRGQHSILICVLLSPYVIFSINQVCGYGTTCKRLQMCFLMFTMCRAPPGRKETKEPLKSSTTTETFRRLYRSDKFLPTVMQLISHIAVVSDICHSEGRTVILISL